MRQPRFLMSGAKGPDEAGLYHCISRVAATDVRFDARAQREFMAMMRMYERFCGVWVLAFCVMPDHIRLLVEVPERPSGGMTEREFFGRLALLYRKEQIDEVRAELRALKRAGDHEGVRAVRERYLSRMWSLSEFMKSLKQRFTQWVNGAYERRGALWDARFKSVIVEDGYAALVIAAYIDLASVRDGLVEDPGEYRACSYGEALAGGAEARAGIARVVNAGVPPKGAEKGKRNWRKVNGEYRKMLGIGKKWPKRQELLERLRLGKQLRIQELLRCKVRFFDDGAVIGSREFVDRAWSENRKRFGARRTSGARPIRGCAELFSLRALQVRAIE